jgi:hypothetical protein
MAQRTTGKCLRAEIRDKQEHMGRLRGAEEWVSGQAPVRRFHVTHTTVFVRDELLMTSSETRWIRAENKDELRMTYTEQVKDYTQPLSKHLSTETAGKEHSKTSGLTIEPATQRISDKGGFLFL